MGRRWRLQHGIGTSDRQNLAYGRVAALFADLSHANVAAVTFGICRGPA